MADIARLARLFGQALRMLEDSEAKLEALRNLLVEGENSGFSDYFYESLIFELDSEKC